MKNLAILLLLSVCASFSYAQSTEPEKTKPTSTELPEKAEKGAEISQMATTIEGGKEKGISISSAARKSSLLRQRAELGNANSEAGKERAALGEANAEKGKEISNQARTGGDVRPALPAQATRPTITVPQARPNPPVVRPTTPERPARPVTPPGGRPGGI
ncbi:hypothetical protein ACFSKL_05465 [Belliella marina]|uniref:Uncharacterized protein n=1 Tax=Belliella marina TaxID=1644146 RepID=A0ABW4VJF5_9BACT